MQQGGFKPRNFFPLNQDTAINAWGIEEEEQDGFLA
jgi:hypothetical protein